MIKRRTTSVNDTSSVSQSWHDTRCKSAKNKSESASCKKSATAPPNPRNSQKTTTTCETLLTLLGFPSKYSLLSLAKQKSYASKTLLTSLEVEESRPSLSHMRRIDRSIITLHVRPCSLRAWSKISAGVFSLSLRELQNSRHSHIHSRDGVGPCR